ncbi:short-chain fatty acyl-CoA regulator family protein [Micromonospora sp. WMMD1082]|uniref:short-chain fatty acyl-CoA regulator family protein n=1 Tax=Micromonospora sp. WMMD1082 TaxID=3016104 RepID=UPI0024167211|nr:short-chain fatty acyl-CoA regulator family protein [Micromonospora sp. WMMD1082]MDG4795641.1 short-chain fatty acyl-CoA regulator family protein [Micromonospora sp. WMMD1082]
MASGKKLYAHAKLRRLRREHGLTQADLARRLDISTSYLNQIENNQRTLTATILLRLAQVLGVDPEYFADTDAERLSADVRTALADEASGTPVDATEVLELVRDYPAVARALVALHQRYQDAAGRVAALAGPTDVPPVLGEPHDAVRDFFYAHYNHFDPLDTAAELLANHLRLTPARTAEALSEYLLDQHGVRVVVTAPPATGESRRFDPASRVLYLAANYTDGQRAFQLATQLAFLEHGHLISELAADLGPPPAAALARIGLGNYYAGALLMPYGDFHARAEELRYDVELLAGHYGVSFETACHRLSTLQRPTLRGVPFSFLRVDRAGNISKRQSATDFHFSRLGGTCPLWIIYEAFAAPGRILTQVAEMPDGKRYFWLARTVTHGGRGHRSPRSTFAVALGCELRHAHRLVYSDGLALDDPRTATPIGLGCRICERRDCAQRARPPAAGRLLIDENRRTVIPYAVDRR